MVIVLWAGWLGFDFSLGYCVYIRSGAYPISYSVITGCTFPRVKVAGP
jgi:hypothetical protein